MEKTQTAKAAAIVVNGFHTDLIGYIAEGQKAAGTMLERMVARVRKQYGKKAPTYTQYTNDQRALAKLAKDRGLASNQWVRKPYATAIKAVFGKLPQNDSPEAARKRAARAKAGADTGHANRKGAKTGQTQDKAPSAAESAEQVVTRLGIAPTMEAIARILEADKATALAAKTMRALAAEMKGGAPVKVVTNTRDTRKVAA